jgi:hypothetical protein
MKKILSLLLGPKKEQKFIVDCVDSTPGGRFTLLDLIQSLETRVEYLEQKYKGALEDIKRLEGENIETTNALYELENRIQSQIDVHFPPIYTMDKYTLGDK